MKNTVKKLCALALSLALAASPLTASAANASSDVPDAFEKTSGALFADEEKLPEPSKDGEEESVLPTGTKDIEIYGVEGVTAVINFDTGALAVKGECGADASYEMNLYYEDAEYVRTIVFTEGVKALPYYGLSMCTKTTTLVLPDGLKSIPSGSFGHFESLKAVTVPDSVESIGSSAFQWCSSLEKVILPSGLKSIGSYAFMGCTSLKNISLPSGLSELGEQVFEESGLESITIPGGVKTVKDYSFSECSDLKTVVFEEGVESVGESAFEYCPLESVGIPSTLKDIPSFIGTPYYKKVAESASDGFVVTPEGVLLAYIGDDENITLPANVKRLARDVFSWTDKIKTADLGENIDYIPDGAFQCCHNLESIKMSDKVTYIGENAFENTLELKEIKLPSSLKRLGNYAFYTSAVEKVTVPESIERIGFYALYDTPYYDTLEGDFVCIRNILIQYRGDDREPVVPDNIKHIGMSSFAGVPITSVTLPQGLLTIDRYAFCCCTDLHAIYVPDSVVTIEEQSIGYDSGSYGVFRYDDIYIAGAPGSEAERYANENDIPFTTALKPSGKIGESAVWEVDLVSRSLTISGTGDTYDIDPQSSDGYNHYSSAIMSITVDEGITSLGNNAFRCLYRVNSLSLPDSLKKIGVNALYGLNAKEIELPANIEEIGYHVCFGSDYYSFEAINVRGKGKRYFSENGVLYDKEGKKIVCVPKNLKQKKVVVPDGITGIEENAIAAYPDVEMFVFPEGFDIHQGKLGTYSASGCTLVFNGDAEEEYDIGWEFDSFISGDNEVYCHFSKKGWKEIAEYYAAGYGTYQPSFHDLDTISKDIALSAEKTEIEPFEAAVISLKVDKFYDTQDYVWSSSNPDVAAVSGNGTVIALGQGSTVIGVRSGDGSQSAEITMTVKGSYEIEPGIKRQLDSEWFGDLSDTNEELVFSERYKGYFILKDSTLYYYSICKDSVTPVYSFNNVYLSNVMGSSLTVCEHGTSDEYTVVCFDLDTLSAVSSVKLTGFVTAVYAVSTDPQGKIYVSLSDKRLTSEPKYLLKVFSQSGKELACAETKRTVVDIMGFPQNGEKMLYVDQDKETTSSLSVNYLESLQLAGINGDKLVPDKYEYGYGEGWIFQVDGIEVMADNSHGRVKYGAAVYADKYAVINCAARNAVIIEDLTDRPDDFAERNDLVYEESVFAEEGICADDEPSYYYVPAGKYCKGTRSVYREKSGSVIMYKQGKQLAQYSLSDGSCLACCPTEHFVYSLDAFGDDLIAIEKEQGNYYLETIAWDVSTSAELTPERTQMTAGEKQQITARHNSNVSSSATNWSSSDPRIATVTQNGTVYAWHEGTVTITLTVGSSSQSCDITVLPRSLAGGAVVTAKGAADINNISGHTYGLWSRFPSSFLFESEQGYTRIVYVPEEDYSDWSRDDYGNPYELEHTHIDAYTLREEYDKNLSLLSSAKIEQELPLFGGAFSGEKYNFIVFGQANPEEDDNCEVLRVVKYSKDWERLDALSLFGKYTTIPFSGGTLRMTEDGGTLYITTCHQMYTYSDGLRHQANMKFWIDEESLSVIDEQYLITDYEPCYVSHSFNQFVEVDNGVVYLADLGDGYPRGAVLFKSSPDKIHNIGGMILKDALPGDDNYTGITLSGLAVGTENVAIAGRTVDVSDTQSSKMNVYIVFADKDSLKDKKEIMLTSYGEDSNVSVSDPFLKDIGEGHFIVLWEESTKDEDYNYSCVVKCVTIDEYGNIANVNTFGNMRLSDCEPLLDSQGRLVWYVCTNHETTFYSVDPMNHPCKHTGRVEPTCTEDGATEAYICEICGKAVIKNDTIPAAAHKEEIVPGKEPTCTEDGLTDGVRCSVCGKTIKEQEKIPALGHKETVQKGYPATCTENGLTDLVYCGRCGEILQPQKVIPALGHDYHDGVCTRCSAEEDTDTHTETPEMPDTGTDKETKDHADPNEEKDLYGDVDGDGIITAADALMILRYSVSLSELSQKQLTAADVDGDGSVTANDALAVLRYSAGISDENKVGMPIVS